MLFVKSLNHLPDESAKELLNACFSAEEATAGTCCNIKDLISSDMKIFDILPSNDINSLINNFAHQIKAFWFQRTYRDHLIRLFAQIFELFTFENVFQMAEGLHQGDNLGP